MIFYKVLPVLFTVFKQPLITKSNNALVAGTWNNFVFWFIIWDSKSLFNHKILCFYFGITDLLTCTRSNKHYTLVKSFIVTLFFSFFQFIRIFMRLNLTSFNCNFSSQISKAWYINDWNRFERNTPFFLYIVLFSETSFSLKISKHSKIIWWIRWYTSNNTSTFIHQNCWQRKSIYFLIRS